MAPTSQQDKTAQTSSITGSFNRPGADYERRMGDVARSIASRIVSLIPSIPPNGTVCDNACGTGAVTDAVLAKYPGTRIEAFDNSEAMVEFTKQRSVEMGLAGQVRADVMDSVKLDFPDALFDMHIMNLAIFFMPDEVRAAREIYRTLKQGGVAVISCYKDSPLGPLLADAESIIQPAAPAEGLSRFDKWSDPETLRGVMSAAGFHDVSVRECPVVQKASTVRDLAEPLSQNLQIIAGAQWTEAEKDGLLRATEMTLESRREEYLTVDEDLEKGVTWTPWLAIGYKR